MKLATLFCLALVPAIAAVAGPPQAQIANSSVRAELYLPDAEQGYYRATRFDWSGIISSLIFNGHNYFGQWFSRYIDMRIAAGQEFTWRIAYDFYTLPASGRN